MLSMAGVPLGNQAVILAGINDSVHIMKKLMHDCVKARVRPYYIYQCDLSEGSGISGRRFQKDWKSLKRCAAIHQDMRCQPLWWMHLAEAERLP